MTWTRPEGGLFIWLTLPTGIDTAALLQRSVVEARVAFVPGAAFFTDGAGRNCARLSYSLCDEAQIAENIARVAALIAADLRNSPFDIDSWATRRLETGSEEAMERALRRSCCQPVIGSTRKKSAQQR